MSLPPSTNGTQEVFDLHDGLTRFRFQGQDFQMDLDEAFEDFGKISKESPDQYERTTRIQAWIKAHCNIDLNRSAANQTEYEVVKQYYEIKKKQETALAVLVGSQPSTASGPADSPGSSASV